MFLLFYSAIIKMRNGVQCIFLVCRTDYLHILIIIVELCILITESKSLARKIILKIHLEYQEN